MIETLALAVKETSFVELSKGSFDIPAFADKLEKSNITSMEKAGEYVFTTKEEESGTEVTKTIFESDTYESEADNLERMKINEASPYSNEINKHISSMEELEVYMNAGLKEGEINGRPCLIRDIDGDYVDPKTGLTNNERMEKGLSPIDSKTGERIELHHIGQSHDGPLAELTENNEHGKNHKTLHPSTEDSWRRDPDLNNQYNNHDRPDHWKDRAQN
jgi:hypothetical protein